MPADSWADLNGSDHQHTLPRGSPMNLACGSRKCSRIVKEAWTRAMVEPLGSAAQQGDPVAASLCIRRPRTQVVRGTKEERREVHDHDVWERWRHGGHTAEGWNQEMIAFMHQLDQT